MKLNDNTTIALLLLLGVASVIIVRKRKQLAKGGKKLDVSNLQANAKEDTPINIDLKKSDNENEISNFFNANGGLVYEITATPNNGTAQINGNVLTYTPKQDFFGTDTIKYLKRDSSGQTSNEGVITVTVSGVYDGSGARDINLTTLEDTPLSLDLDSNKGVTSKGSPTKGKPTTNPKGTPPSNQPEPRGGRKVGFDGSFTKKTSGIVLDFNGDY